MIGQLSNPWWAFVLLGICAGIVSGTLGLGGGTILVPALVLLFCFEQKSAQGMALAAMVPIALVGALRYWRNTTIEMNAAVIALIVCGAVAGALIGTELAGRMPSHILRKIFAIVLIVAAVKMFVGTPKRRNADLDHSTPDRKPSVIERRGPASDTEQR